MCKHFKADDGDIFHALPPFDPLTVKHTPPFCHSSSPLLPVAACHIESQRLICPPFPDTYPCSYDSQTFVARGEGVQSPSPLPPAMIASRFCSAKPGPWSSLAPPIVFIPASNETASLTRWPSEIVYPPPPRGAFLTPQLSASSTT